ncbi:retrovirus-related pol polyprotein from transposon TNT 1-94 [Tanacetum coccineum]
MDLCGPMRVESINGKKYVLVIVNDYSRYTWIHFLRSKDKTPGVLIDFLTLVQRGLHTQVTTKLQFKPHVLASKAKKTAKNHDLLALIAHSNASSSQSHANSSYSPQPYYVTHPSFVVDYEDEYQGGLQGDSQEDKLITAMMLLARAITQKFSTPTNNRLRTSSNTRNQAVIQNDHVDIQTKNAGYGGNGNKNTGRQSRNQAFNAGNGNDDSHYACDYQKPRVRNAKYFKEQMLLAMKDEAGSNLTNKENDFMLDTSYGEETMEKLTAAVMLMARIQLADGNAKTVPSYDAKAVSKVNASSKVHDQMRHEKRKTIIQTSDDDQIDSNIIFDDPYVENNGGTSDHESNDHDEYHKIQMLAYDVQREAENKK